MRAVILAAVLLLAGVLTVSLVSKIRGRSHFTAFAGALVDLGVAPPRWSRPAAALAVAAEAVVLAGLSWPGRTVAGAAAATLLFAGFTVVLARAVRRGAGVSCHCFGASGPPVSRRHVLRAGFLCAVSLGVLAGSTPAGTLAGAGAPQLLGAFAAAAVGVAALVRLDDLVWLFRGAAPTP